MVEGVTYHVLLILIFHMKYCFWKFNDLIVSKSVFLYFFAALWYYFSLCMPKSPPFLLLPLVFYLFVSNLSITITDFGSKESRNCCSNQVLKKGAFISQWWSTEEFWIFYANLGTSSIQYFYSFYSWWRSFQRTKKKVLFDNPF